MRILFGLICISFLLSCASTQQSTDSETENATPSINHEVVVFESGRRTKYEDCREPKRLAELKGGNRALLEQVQYPLEARKRGDQGIVVHEILIDREGNVVDTRLTRSASYLLNKEALRVVKLAKFIPAQCNGEIVSMYESIPITFREKG